MKRVFIVVLVSIFMTLDISLEVCRAEEDAATKALKSGLIGAGTGAIAAGATGGKAGKGALIGAGTGVIGSVLMDAISGGAGGRQPVVEDDDEYYEAPQEDPTAKVIKQGIVGAGTGAISAGMTGGKAGQGALIGAGTGAIGGALLDSITAPKSQRKVRRSRRTDTGTDVPKTKIIRKYDEEGNLIYEEIVPVE